MNAPCGSTFHNNQPLPLHVRDVLHESTRLRSDELEAAPRDTGAALRPVILNDLPTDDERLAGAHVWVKFLAVALDDAVLTARHTRNSCAVIDRLVRLHEAEHLLRSDDPLLQVEGRVAALE